MSDFRRVTDTFWASPQLELVDVAEAARSGFTCLINNRPDDETPDQPAGIALEQAARDAGLAFYAIPVAPGGFTQEQLDATITALGENEGKILAFCRSGTRSTLLWALAQARLGRDLDEIAREAAGAGYDIGPILPLMERLAER